MSGIKFMGEQPDPDMDTAEGRGFPRIYDGTKRSMLDDVRTFIEAIANDDDVPGEHQIAARQLLKHIDEGER